MTDDIIFVNITKTPVRIIAVVYAIVKLFFTFFFDIDHIYLRAISGAILIVIIFILTSEIKISRRILCVAVPFSVAVIETAAVVLSGGDRLIYIYLIGCSLVCLMYIDIRGLLITMSLVITKLVIILFVFNINLLGSAFTIYEEVFYFSGLLMINALILLFAAYAIKAFSRSFDENEIQRRQLTMEMATLSALFDSVPSLIYIKDAQSRFTRCNKAFLEHFGINKEDIIGKTDIDGPGLPKILTEGYSNISRSSSLKSQKVIREWQIPSANKVNMLFEITLIPLIIENESIGVIGIAFDITQRKEHELSMAINMKQMRSQSDALGRITKSPTISAGDLKAATDIITKEGCSVLRASRVVVWKLNNENNSIESISCYESGISNYAFLNDYSMKDNDEYIDLLKSERLLVMSNKKECRLITDKDAYGEYHDLCAALESPIRIDGVLVGLVSIEQHVCDEYPEKRIWKAGEMNFASSLADLVALSISGYERRKAQDEAQDANQAKSDFLANMSHEIRTPMNVIMGLTEILLDSEGSVKDIKDHLESIRTSGSTLTEIVNDILDMSKIEAGKFIISPVKYDVASLLYEVTSLNMLRIEGKPISFELKLDGNIFKELFGDDLRVKQIMNNLLSNAFKYTQKGKVTLDFRSMRDETGSVILSFAIHDTGIGIRHEDMDKLFDDYQRVDARANRAVSGTGLGLSITKELVEFMDGEITVESQYGVGSVFRVKIRQGFINGEFINEEDIENLRKFHYENSNDNTEEAKVERPDLGWAYVLVVDDSPTNLVVARGLLGKYNMKIDCVMSGQEAVDLVKNGNPEYNAVFMDHMMPGMDGIEAAGLIRNIGTKYAKTVPMLALTANALAGNEQMFLDNGFQAFLSKPINTNKLDAIVRQWIMKNP